MPALVSCTKPDKGVLRQDGSDPLPVALLVEREITGPILNSDLRRPFGLARDARGNIYLNDSGNDRLLRLKADLTADREIGGYGAQTGLLNRPTFVAVDNSLNLMVSDEGNRRVSRYNSQLAFVDALSFYDEDDPLKFGYPSGIAFTDYGEVWVADRDNNQIAIFNNVGKFDRFLGDYGYSGGQLSSPEKIARDERGNFIVCDAGNARVAVYDSYGNFAYETGLDGDSYPIAATADKTLLWVLDRRNSKVLCFDREGYLVFEVGPALPGGESSLKNPSDLIILSSGMLLISDTGNNRLVLCRIVYEDK